MNVRTLFALFNSTPSPIFRSQVQTGRWPCCTPTPQQRRAICHEQPGVRICNGDHSPILWPYPDLTCGATDPLPNCGEHRRDMDPTVVSRPHDKANRPDHEGANGLRMLLSRQGKTIAIFVVSLGTLIFNILRVSARLPRKPWGCGLIMLVA